MNRLVVNEPFEAAMLIAEIVCVYKNLDDGTRTRIDLASDALKNPKAQGVEKAQAFAIIHATFPSLFSSEPPTAPAQSGSSEHPLM